jgi:hypothetical protein
MIAMIFKFTLAFGFSFIILSFNVNQKPIFYHLSQVTGPLGQDVQESFGRSVKRSITKSKIISKGLFNNASPKYYDDQINSSQSSLHGKIDNEMILEEIKRDEARKLDDLIKKN